MPSAHAQFGFFFATYLSLHHPRRYRVLLLFPIAAAIAASRVYLGYHYVSQVLAGSLFGLVMGAVWFLVVAVARRVGLVRWGVSVFGPWLRMKDSLEIGTYCIEDLVDSEYREWVKTVEKTKKSKGQ